MAREVYRFAVTIPAGTPIANPQVSNLTMPGRTISRIEVIIPPGPRGNVGWQLTTGGLQIFPSNAGQFFTADGEKVQWDVNDLPSNSAWQVTAYNTGTLSHSLEFRFLADVLVTTPAHLGFVPLDLSRLAG